MRKRCIKYLSPIAVTDGAGVRLKRLIGTRDFDHLDPFLLLDHFGSKNSDDYIAGFPMHPHRGIETVTYMLEGRIRHRDSVGNAGAIERGGVQWMTAGSGIMHEEMPEIVEKALDGFQLWLNLAAKEKMTAPKYQEFAADQIPSVETDWGSLKLICGEIEGCVGPVSGTSTTPLYADLSINPSERVTVNLGEGKNAAFYVFEGDARSIEMPDSQSDSMLVFSDDGDHLELESGAEGCRGLLIAATPLDEPIARYGPFVMNTEGEIRQALIELQENTFVKVR